MTFSALLAHLVNFLAPALVVAVLLTLMSSLPPVSGTRRKGHWRVLLWLSVAGSLVLLLGLIGFGRDGKMATYAALVVVQGSVAWAMRRRA